MALHVVVKGRGKPVLVLHGLLSDHTQMYPLLPSLKGCRSYMPDLLGCGKTSERFSVDIVRENAAILVALCTKHRIQTVIAYSMAGMIGLELQLPKTVFIAAYCTNPVEHGPLSFIRGRELAAELLLVRYRQQLQQLMQRMQYKDLPGLDHASAEAGLYYLVASLADRKEQASTLRDALVIHGTHDRIVDSRLGEELSRLCDASALFVAEDHASVLSNKEVHATLTQFVQAP